MTNKYGILARLGRERGRILAESRQRARARLSGAAHVAVAAANKVIPLDGILKELRSASARFERVHALLGKVENKLGLAPSASAAGRPEGGQASDGSGEASLVDAVQRLANKPLISIVVPVYNTPRALLTSCIESVRAQVYPHWELCIADDGSLSAETRGCLAHYARLDGRIQVVTSPQNRGISHASNLALKQASGEYVALLDHDDELTPDALYWVAETLNRKPDADLLYSDEDKLDAQGRRCQPFHKPDWSPELLWNCMYTGHLSVYRTALVRALGGFRSEYDFSQDYDLALRVTETTDQIEHIPRILYHWRQAAGSAAAGGKDYARISNIAALQAAVDRRGIDAEVEALPTANRVKLRRRKPVRVSLIIPTDSEKNLGDSLESIYAKTRYPDLEIVVVTNSKLADTMRQRYPGRTDLVFCRFDKPFNFSLKCNEGVEAASGEIVVFFNDDVRPLDDSWVDDLIEYLALPEIGAVSPKLLYENHTIQHAGLVTGVRGLVGTAFHCQPAESTDYFNFALSVRDASAISGACLAMRKRDFTAIGGYDAENVPISHSDVDLCFRVREHGLRCVYTPYTTLLHIGHLSLREFEVQEKQAKQEEKKRQKKSKRAEDKADVFLLRRWAGYTGHDPYYTQPMRDLLYRDSPAPWILYGENNKRSYTPGRDALFISHDLSDSGAPMVLYYAVEHFLKSGGFAAVLTPLDGPFRARFQALGVPVIVDSAAFTQAAALSKLVANFDLVFANTVECWPLVRVAEEAGVPTLWYVHESGYIDAQTGKECRETLQRARSLWVGSWRALQACRKYNPAARIMEYGVPDILKQPLPSGQPVRTRQPGDKLVISLLGSVEPRKGQDIFVRAIQGLPKRDQERAEFNLVGRELVPRLGRWLAEELKGLPSVRLRGNVDLDEYRRLILESDVFVCASRDDTLPLVTLDALAAGKVLLCTDTTGTSAFLEDGVSGFVIENENVGMLSTRLSAIIRDPSGLVAMGQRAREVYVRHFSLPSFTERLDQALGELLGPTSDAVAPGAEPARDPGATPAAEPAAPTAERAAAKAERAPAKKKMRAR